MIVIHYVKSVVIEFLTVPGLHVIIDAVPDRSSVMCMYRFITCSSRIIGVLTVLVSPSAIDAVPGRSSMTGFIGIFRGHWSPYGPCS